MIEIFAGSHLSVDAHNSMAFDDINELLLGERNPYQEVFQEETLFLDSTDRFIGIQHHAYLDLYDYMRDEDLVDLVDWMRTEIEVDDIYIGDLVFNR